MIRKLVLAAVAAASLAAPAASMAQEYRPWGPLPPPPAPAAGWGYHGWDHPHFWGGFGPPRFYRAACFREWRPNYWGGFHRVTICR